MQKKGAGHVQATEATKSYTKAELLELAQCAEQTERYEDMKKVYIDSQEIVIVCPLLTSGAESEITFGHWPYYIVLTTKISFTTRFVATTCPSLVCKLASFLSG